MGLLFFMLRISRLRRCVTQLTRTSWRVPIGNSGNKEVLVSKIITPSFPISWIFYTFVVDITYSTQGVAKVYPRCSQG